ncbi:MAG: histidinol-phosphatase HisJ family protein [Oscillospiraceae bacterium]|jgi:histidinol-phosphatase (PHP family)|nr:histidinol-phosphatase HisJ family protein [Oscillospiraceae bacterium]
MSCYWADVHTHSVFSADGHDTMGALAEAAVCAGLSALCITDHYDTWSSFDPGPHHTAFEEAHAAVSGRLALLRGVELGEGHTLGARAEALLASGPFDFVLGSCHCVHGKPDFYDMPRMDRAACLALIAEYLAEVLAMVRWGRFDVLGHLTYPLRYMVGRDGAAVDFSPFHDELRALFRAVVEGGHGLEVNVSNLRKPGGFPMPDLPLLTLYRACGGEIVTVGSDAHRTGEVGAHIREGYALLREAGFQRVAVYENRRPVWHPLR